MTDPTENKAAPVPDDIPLVEADYDYFATTDRTFNFLMDVSDKWVFWGVFCSFAHFICMI